MTHITDINPVAPQWQQRGSKAISAGDLVLLLGNSPGSRIGFVMNMDDSGLYVWAFVNGKIVKHLAKLCLFSAS